MEKLLIDLQKLLAKYNAHIDGDIDVKIYGLKPSPIESVKLMGISKDAIIRRG